MLWLALPQWWKTRLGEKFRSNCWQHQALWLRKCATYNKEIVGLPRFIDSLLMAPFQMKVQAKQIRYKATRYLIINDQLYKQGFNLPYLRCLTPAEAETVIREIHEEVCEDPAGSRSLVHKAFHQGYYWLTLHQDAIRISRSYDKCQRYTTIPPSLPEPLTLMISHWPFAQWGLDLIGPMHAGRVRSAMQSLQLTTSQSRPK
ncbi:hypothetical protein ACFX2J_031890 [Malus domestica]